jgi:hypothetical protein
VRSNTASPDGTGGVDVGVPVCVGVDVSVRVEVGDEVDVRVRVGVRVGLAVAVPVGVRVCVRLGVDVGPSTMKIEPSLPDVSSALSCASADDARLRSGWMPGVAEPRTTKAQIISRPSGTMASVGLLVSKRITLQR